MLAILTKMTLTQVSTWFANARRRLKKENKMTWSSKDGEDEDDEDGPKDGDSDHGDRDDSLCGGDIDIEDIDSDIGADSSSEHIIARVGDSPTSDIVASQATSSGLGRPEASTKFTSGSKCDLSSDNLKPLRSESHSHSEDPRLNRHGSPQSAHNAHLHIPHARPHHLHQDPHSHHEPRRESQSNSDPGKSRDFFSFF